MPTAPGSPSPLPEQSALPARRPHALPANQDLLEAIFERSTLALHVLRSVRDAAGRIVDFEVIRANPRADALAGYPILGRRMLVDWPHARQMGLFYGVVRAAETGEFLDLEQEFNADGARGWFRWTAEPLGDGAVMAIEDITARRQAAAEVQRLQQQQAQAVLQAQEAERRRIAESLHNGLAQLLFAAKLQLERLPVPAAPFATNHRQARELLAQAIAQTRTLSHELTPAILEDFGLAAAVQEVCRLASTASLRLRCVIGELPPLPQPVALAVYRMAQELAQNIAKHAQATEAQFSVFVRAGHLGLRAQDNGRGFDPGHAPADGIGLRALKGRVKLLNGQFRLRSSAVRGTVVSILIPLGAWPPEPLG